MQSPRDPAFVQDPYPFYDRARALGPLFLWEDYGFPCAAGHAEVGALLRDRRFGRELPSALSPARPDHLADFYALDDRSMLDREPPSHTRLRGLVLRAFTSRRIAALGPEIAALAEGLIDRLPRGRVRPDRRLRRAAAGRRDRPPSRRARGDGASASRLVARHGRDVPGPPRPRRSRPRANAAARDFAAFLRDYVAERRLRPGDDLITALIAAEAEGDRLDTEELIATCVLLLNAGHEATVHAIGNGVAAILGAGLDAARLFADPAATAATVEEVLRFDPPLHLFTRFALADVEVFGHRFRTGDTVGCLLAAANRDPARFPDPGRFDPARPAGPHLAFGAGIHFCVGAPLARAELATALPILFARRPGLALASPPAFADRYHFRGLAALRLTS